MKAKFKKDFIKSFNEKYNYENESLLKEITPKQPILKRRRLCYLSIILITMLLSVSITYVVVGNRFIHDSDDSLYNEIIEYSNNRFFKSDIIELNKINNSSKDKIYLFYTEIDDELFFIIGVQSNHLKDTIEITINEKYAKFEKNEKLQIFEFMVHKEDNYNISLEYYINNEIQLKFVENFKI